MWQETLPSPPSYRWGIAYRYRDPDGYWGPATCAYDPGSNEYPSHYPALDVDDVGNVHVAWQQDEQPGDASWRYGVRYRRRAAATGEWGPVTAAATGPEIAAGAPDLVCHGDGAVDLSFPLWTSPIGPALAVATLASGTLTGTVLFAEDPCGQPSTITGSSSVCVDQDSVLHLVWEGAGCDGAVQTLYAARAGDLWTDPVQVSQGVSAALDPTVAVSLDGVLHVTHTGQVAGYWDVYHVASYANRPPELDPIGDRTVDEGQLLSFAISATDPDEDPLTYSASNLPEGATFDPLTQQFTWTPGQGQAGSYPGVAFAVSDGLLSDTEEISIEVTSPPLAEVQIDIKPGSERNPVNPKSQGVLPVAVFSSDTFNATDIDPSTVLLAGAPVAQNPDDGKWMMEENDEDGDGLMDVRLHFDTELIDVGLLDDGYAIMNGLTTTGREFTGRDIVTIVPQDIPNDHWAIEAIAECVRGAVVQGYPDGSYRPVVPVTRDQMAVFTARALAGGDEQVPSGPATATFPDVPTDHWAYRWVEYAVANTIVAGYGDGTYRPEVQVDRSQMAVFIARSMVPPTDRPDLPGYAPPEVATFTDVPTDHWAYRYIEYIAQESVAVSQGYPDGTYRPATAVTRDQMAVYVARAFELPM